MSGTGSLVPKDSQTNDLVSSPGPVFNIESSGELCPALTALPLGARMAQARIAQDGVATPMAHPTSQQTFRPGPNVFVVNDSPVGPYSAFFDDDGEAGYFYAVDLACDSLILDVLPVYDMRIARGQKRPSALSIVWSLDGQKCALLINGLPQAAFDFAAQRGYSRARMTRPAEEHNRGTWAASDHSWSDAAVGWLQLRKSA